MLILLNANIAKSKLIAERLSAKLMIVHSALAMGIYIIYIFVYNYVCNASARMRRHVRVPAVRSMGMNSCVCVYCTIILAGSY